MSKIMRTGLLGMTAILVLLMATQALGESQAPARPLQDKFVYLPVIELAQRPCDAGAVAQLKSVSKWQGQFTFAFKGSASGTWPGGDTEETRVDHAMSMSTIVLSKTHDTATFVQWRQSEFVPSGQLIVNDSDVRIFKLGGSSSATAQFTAVAGSDVVSIALYPDQCKLRFNLDSTAVGPVTGDLFPNNYFTLCAVMDTKSPNSGDQKISTTVPAYVRGGATAGSYEDVRKAGFNCRVGGGDPSVSDELFTTKLAWLLDGATTTGPRGKGLQPMGTMQITYAFSPLP
jgi:hypothetical protein